MVGHVRADGSHLLFAQDVHARHLDEAAALSEARQTSLDEALAGQAVQNHVDTGAAGVTQDGRAKGRRAAVVNVLHA